MSEKEENKSWIKKIASALSNEPRSKKELIDILREGASRNLVDRNSLAMIEGVLEVHEQKAKEIMIPRSQMITIDYDLPIKEIIKIVINSGHSRFPVIGENKDTVIGILLAKDLLTYYFHNKKLILKDILRIAECIPESKRLDNLLQDFRHKRNHMAIVVDEYGALTGLITIEDVIEQIVGDIEDEHDAIDAPVMRKRADNSYSVKALTTLEEFNEVFNTNFSDNEVETIGGFILKKFGHLPIKGETVKVDNLVFKILKADDRRIFLIQVIPQKTF